jgi:hypothetical protein
MMPCTTVQALGQARLAELHHQAQRDALARAARRARRQHSAHLAPRLLAAHHLLGSPPRARAGDGQATIDRCPADAPAAVSRPAGRTDS